MTNLECDPSIPTMDDPTPEEAIGWPDWRQLVLGGWYVVKYEGYAPMLACWESSVMSPCGANFVYGIPGHDGHASAFFRRIEGVSPLIAQGCSDEKALAAAREAGHAIEWP